jgi:hypothetical protein
MNDYDDLDEYNGEPEHDMWVDYDYNANTGELDFIDDDTEEYDDFIDDDSEDYIDDEEDNYDSEDSDDSFDEEE